MIRSITTALAALALMTSLAWAAPTVILPPRAAHPSRPLPLASPSVPGPSISPNPAPSGGAAFDVGVWTVHASSLDANFKNGDFSTPEKVVITRVGGDITADRANGNYKKQVVYLNGNVVMHDSSGNAGGLAGGPPSRAGAPSTLTADKAQIDGAAKIYKAIGNVHYVQSDTVVDADNGTLNDDTHDLFLQGNVHIVQGHHTMSAQSVVYNTISSKAHAEGDVTIQFPSQLRRGLATPKPLHVPKNPITVPVATASP